MLQGRLGRFPQSQEWEHHLVQSPEIVRVQNALRINHRQTNLFNFTGFPRRSLCLGCIRCSCPIGLARFPLHQAQDRVTIVCLCLIQLLSIGKRLAISLSISDTISHRFVVRDEHFIFDRLIFVRHPVCRPLKQFSVQKSRVLQWP